MELEGTKGLHGEVRERTNRLRDRIRRLFVRSSKND